MKREVSRRTVIEWLGQGTVLGLGTVMASSCGVESTGIAGGGTPRGSDAPGDSSFPFAPGSAEQSVYEDWDENTVDPQNLDDGRHDDGANDDSDIPF